MDPADALRRLTSRAAIVSAMYRVYADSRELSREAVATELGATVPLSRARAESISELRAWAAGRAIPASA